MHSTHTAQLESRFLELADSNRARFRRIARVYAPGTEADDLLQEIWLQVWRSLPSFDNRSALQTWAYRVALNTCLAHRRKRRPAMESFDEKTHRPQAASVGDAPGILEEFAASLNPVDRAVLLLHLDSQPADAMASILGMSSNAVAIRLTRIRRQFESRYIEE